MFVCDALQDVKENMMCVCDALQGGCEGQDDPGGVEPDDRDEGEKPGGALRLHPGE